SPPPPPLQVAPVVLFAALESCAIAGPAAPTMTPLTRRTAIHAFARRTVILEAPPCQPPAPSRDGDANAAGPLGTCGVRLLMPCGALRSRPQCLDRRDAELALLQHREAPRPELVVGVGRGPREARLPVRRLRLVAEEVRVGRRDRFVVLADRRAEVLRLLQIELLGGRRELVGRAHLLRDEARRPGADLHLVALVVVDGGRDARRRRRADEALAGRHEEKIRLHRVDEDRAELVVDLDMRAAGVARRLLEGVRLEVGQHVEDALGVLVRRRAEVLRLQDVGGRGLELIDETHAADPRERRGRLRLVAEEVVGAAVGVRGAGADTALAGVRPGACVAVVARRVVREREVCGTRVVHAVAGLGDVAGAGRGAADRGRRLLRVGRAVVARTVAALGGVADAGRSAADARALRVRGTRVGRSGAVLREV